MKVLAMNSSGDKTSISVILDDEINSFTMSHERKDRPNWEMFLENVGHKQIFNLNEIDVFAFENNQNSYTATRITASYLKGITSALKKPLISIEGNLECDLDIEDLLITAKDKFLSDDINNNRFDPKNANPIYNDDIKFKKLDE